MSKNNLQSSFTENKYHVKLYKRGKQWVAMGITLATLAGISFATSTTANAAETTTNDPTANVSQSAPTTTSGTEVVINTPAATGNADTSIQMNKAAGTNSVSSDNPTESQAAATTPDSQTQPADTHTASNAGKQAAVNTPTALKSPATPAPATSTPTVDPTVPAPDKSGAASTDLSNPGSRNESPTVVTSDSKENQPVANVSGKVIDTVNTPDLKAGDTDNIADNLQKVIVQVGDKNWTTTGESGSKINYDTTAITSLVPLGDALVGPVKDLLTAVGAPINFDADATKNQVVTLPLSTTLVTTRTIHLVNSNGKSLAPDVVQPVYWVGVPFKDNSFVVYTPISWYPSLDVPTISGYTTDTTEVPAADPMIMGTKPENPSDISIIYIGNQTTADVTIPSNQGNQTVSNVSGRVGDIFTVPVPVIDGYTADKSAVLATVNPDGSITVNDPKATSGDAGYVTYTSNTSNVPNPGNNNGQTGNPSDTGNSGNLDNNSQDRNVISPTDTTTQPGTAVTTPTTPSGSSSKTATTPSVNGTKSADSNTSQSTDHGTVVANPNTSATNSSSAIGQQPTTNLSSAVTTAGQSAAGQAMPNETATNSNETRQTTSGQLPQTNEQSHQTQTAGVLGLIMLSLLGLFGLRRKETDDK